MRLPFLLLTCLLALLSGCGGNSQSADPAPDSSNPTPTDPGTDPGSGTDPDPEPGDGDGGTTSPAEINFRPDNGTPPSDCTPNSADVSASNGALENTGADNTYSLTGYTEDTNGSNLTGTWIIVARDNTEAPVRRMQKYFMVIRQSGGGYEMANCNAMPTETIETTKQWVDQYGYPVHAGDPKAVAEVDVITQRTYNAWQPFVLPQVPGSAGEIILPLYTTSERRPENGMKLTAVGTSRLQSANGAYQGLKIATSTAALGTVSANINGNASTAADVWCVVQSRLVEQQCTNSGNEPEPIVDSFIRVSSTDRQLGIASSSLLNGQYLLVSRTVLENIGVRQSVVEETTPSSFSITATATQIEAGIALTEAAGSINLTTTIPVAP